MSILKIIQQDAVPNIEKIEHRGETYTLYGYPSATVLAKAMLQTPEAIETKVAHYSRLTKSDFTKELVVQVQMVASALQHEEDPEQRYDESVIAQLAVKDGALFLKLSGAAAKVYGFDDGADAVARAAAGESEDVEQLNSN